MQDLEAVIIAKERFQSSSIPAQLRQRVWAFLQGLQLPADQIVLHTLPHERDPELSLPQHSGFLMYPPVPSGAEGRRRSRRGQAPSRSFNSYKANKPFPVDGSSDGSDGRYLCCLTCAVYADAPSSQQQQPPTGQQQQQLAEEEEEPAGQQQRQIATYRLYACIVISEQKPEDANGHRWQQVVMGRRGVDDAFTAHLWCRYRSEVAEPCF